jgi:predicted nucleotidyltransferase
VYPNDKVVEKLVRQVVEIIHPLQIILFGSAARGTMGPDSDLDLLIVMPEGTRRRRTAQRLYREIKGLGAPFDLLVTTPSELEKHKDNIGLIYRTVLQEVKELYVA